MNTDATQFLDQSARRFRRRVGLLLLTIACGIVGLLYVREWLRSRGPAYGSVAMLLHNELADWSPGSCAVFDEKGRIIFAYATTIPRPVVERIGVGSKESSGLGVLAPWFCTRRRHSHKCRLFARWRCRATSTLQDRRTKSTVAMGRPMYRPWIRRKCSLGDVQNVFQWHP
jgi:hypothetical protein